MFLAWAELEKIKNQIKIPVIKRSSEKGYADLNGLYIPFLLHDINI